MINVLTNVTVLCYYDKNMKKEGTVMKEKIKGLIMGMVIGAMISTTTVFAMTGAVQKLIEYSNMKIMINGEEITPTDANGEYVEPFAIEGTTYLPVRAVANALGLDVGWDMKTKTVQLSKKKTEEQSSGMVVYEKNGVRISYKDFSKDDFSSKFNFLVENNSGYEICVQARDESLNGFMVSGIMSQEVQPGKKAYATLTYFNGTLEQNNINHIDSLELSFHIFDSQTWDTIDDSDIIKINP